MDRRPRVDPDKPILVNPFRPTLPVRPEEYNQRNEEIEQAASLVGTGTIGVSSTPSGKVITALDKKKFWAIISGTANPYKFKEAIMQANGTWIPLAGGLVSGTTFSAYELNAITNLDGSVQLLRPGAYPDYRFQSLKYGPDHHTPPCNFTISLTNRDGNVPVSGGTVSITTGDGSTCSGTTDGSGMYTCSFPTIPTSPLTIMVTYGSCSYTGPIFCNETLELCYCEANVHLTSNAGTPVLSPAPSGGVPWPGTDDGEGNYTYCKLAPCASHFDLPAIFLAHAEASGYVPACQFVTVNCGDDISINLILAQIPGCYITADYTDRFPGYPITLSCCEHFCNPSLPQNPSTLAEGGLIPTILRVKFTSLINIVTGIPPFFVSWFGADEDVFFDLPITSDTSGFTGMFGGTPYRQIIWSACHGGGGNFIGKWGLLVNQLRGDAPPGAEIPIFYGSCKPFVILFCSPAVGASFYVAGYSYYKNGGCVPQLTSEIPRYDRTAGGLTFDKAFLCGISPCGTIGAAGSGATFGAWDATIMDGCCDYMMATMPLDRKMAYGPKFDPHALVVRGYGDSSSGYGRMTAQMIKELEKQDISTSFQPINLDESRSKLDPFLKDRIKPGDEPSK